MFDNATRKRIFSDIFKLTSYGNTGNKKSDFYTGGGRLREIIYQKSWQDKGRNTQCYVNFESR